ncbi:MAG TPA: hypothetical protein VIH21_04150, partial [Dehalococcoidia bacterium]
NLRAMLHLCDGEWAEAETVWREGHEDFLQVGSMTTYLSRTALIAHVCYVQGHYDEFARLAGDQVDRVAGGGHVLGEVRARTQLALAFAVQARPDEAQQQVTAVRQLLARGEDWGSHAVSCALADAAAIAARGDSHGAIVRFGEAAALARARRLPWSEAEARRLCAGEHSRAGDPSSAATERAAAEAIYRTIGAGTPWIARLNKGV